LRDEIGRVHWAGVGNVKAKLVNPRNTSQRCSGCGALPAERKPLSVRKHVCGECGLRLDRDVNAARNILRLGASEQRTSGCEVHRQAA
jgi:putative transposase